MKKYLVVAALVSVVALVASPVFAKDANEDSIESDPAKMESMTQQQLPTPMKQDHLFEERAGTWKATCDRMEEGKVYCRMFHIEQFGEWKTKNFIQVGPAWTPDSVGFVVATYLGFKDGSTVTIGIDKHDRHEITATKRNNLMLSPEHAAKILQEMESGHKIVVTFNSHSGVRHLTLADLEPYRELLAKVKTQMAKNSPSSAQSNDQ